MNDPYRRRSPDGFDDDAIFADIVAHLNDVATEDEPAVPEAEGVATENESAPDPATERATSERMPPPSAEEPRDDLDKGDQGFADQPRVPPEAPADGEPQTFHQPHGWRQHEINDEIEDHFEPPPAAPLPAGDLQFWGIIVGMGGGPLLLLFLVFFNREASSYWILTAIAMSVGGFALLVARMPGHHEDDDDGARL